MTRTALNVVLFAPLLLAAACEQPMPPVTAPPPRVAAQPEKVWTPEELMTRRAADLNAIASALEAHRAARGGYPVTVGYHNIAEHGANWIPGLAPDFIAQVPREPLGSSNAGRPQYWYVSDGTNYKLIIHGLGEDCGSHVEQFGLKTDPARTRENGSCWAFGLFSESLAGY